MTKSAWATALGGLLLLGCQDADFGAKATGHAAAGMSGAGSSSDGGSGDDTSQAGAAQSGSSGMVHGHPVGAGGTSGSAGGPTTAGKGSTGGTGGHVVGHGGTTGSGGTGGDGATGGAGIVGGSGGNAGEAPSDTGGSPDGSGGTGGFSIAGGGGTGGGEPIGCNDDPILVSVHVYQPSILMETDPKGRAYHSISTWFKNQQASCHDVYGGTEIGAWLGDGERGDFAFEPKDICLKDDQGTYGATFLSTPEPTITTTLLSRVKDWDVSQYCLRVSVNNMANTSEGTYIAVDEVWEIHGTGTPYPPG